ncbi:hypothetical protein PF010_g15260 [Phytophthora fragariae]|uniref:Secreted protein n=1 Tax=Phytophthora fragariae TaxID=53985 RepID=A0A6A3KBQ0_9STRA|nr:hypothetical protein PF003_g11779 [Phytophthora fragariae]KAE9005000.1 hypothetical protein PF011_g12226 [Phytophthora fragariae]KAE9099279.1 hypothetical protein PF010_g15260 [Phytophthora fragariae]KAE9222700.1 hypothetical protein PF004_g12729 [Phytophthora fragariae]KAE9223795.1 hypothetical protein PF002_g14879 [Phytophthora fragariae]
MTKVLASLRSMVACILAVDTPACVCKSMMSLIDIPATFVDEQHAHVRPSRPRGCAFYCRPWYTGCAKGLSGWYHLRQQC